MLQNPYQMGDLGVNDRCASGEGEVYQWIGTGEKLATSENLKNPEIDSSCIHPRTRGVPSTGDPGPKTKKWRVLVIPKATANEYSADGPCRGGQGGARNSATSNSSGGGPRRRTTTPSRSSSSSPRRCRRGDGIVLAPVDSKSWHSPSMRRSPAGSRSSSSTRAGIVQTVSFVATDNYHGGVLAGKRMAELLGGKGNVIVLRHMVGSESTEQRRRASSIRSGGIRRSASSRKSRCRAHGRLGTAAGDGVDHKLPRPVERDLYLERGEHHGNAQSPEEAELVKAPGEAKAPKTQEETKGKPWSSAIAPTPAPGSDHQVVRSIPGPGPQPGEPTRESAPRSEISLAKH